MTRRKQLKPRALTVKQNAEAEEDDNKTLRSSSIDEQSEEQNDAKTAVIFAAVAKDGSEVPDEIQNKNIANNDKKDDADREEKEANYESDNSDCDSIGSYSSELYSSHSSISFPSSSNSTSEEMETNEIDVDDPIKKEKKDKSGSSSKFKGASSYKCQFCEKSFPRLGYLKKHEQSHEDYMPFKCPVCQRLFKHKRSRDRHLKLHTGDRRYKCLFCESAFSRSDHLKIHMKTHDSKKAFQCSFCNRGYNTAAALTSHMQNHKKQNELRERNESPYNYSMKSESSSTSTTDKKRIEMISPKSVKSDSQFEIKNQIRCFYCTKTNFSTLEQLTHHINIMHNHRLMNERKTNSRSEQQQLESHFISCEYCLMKFSSSEKLIKHIQLVHENRLQANEEFLSPKNVDSPNSQVQQHNALENKKNSSRYSEHEEQPTDLSQRIVKKIKMENFNYAVPKLFEAPTLGRATPGTPDVFLCNQCNASLPSFELFRLHLKNHLEESYGSVGGTRSSEYFELSSNSNNNAFYHSQKKFICQQCRDVVFDNRFEYDQHIEQHYTEFLCQECDDSFTKHEDLQNHLLENHVRFKCTLCNESLESIMSLKLHFASRHSDKRCSTCHEFFRSERDFKNHIQSKHSSVDLIKCIFCRVTCSSELEMHFHFLSTHVKQFRCPACSESFHVEFLLDRHLQTHHSVNESQVNSTFNIDKETLNLQNYHPSLIESYREKFLLNHDPKMNDASNFLHKLNPSVFPLNPLNNQYTKNINLSSLHDSLSRVQSTIDEHQQQQQSMRVKNLYHLTSEAINKQINSNSDAQSTSFKLQNLSNSNSIIVNDKNNNKNSSFKEKTEASSQQQQQPESSTEKSSHIIHLNTKTGVSLKCAYCEAREDFKSRTELENHMKVQHNIAAKHKCSICDEILPSPAVLAEHKLQHCKVISGKCFHCADSIENINDFKQHIQNHNQKNKASLELPVHCICCHQLLTSDFEINLHAKFHTNTASTSIANDEKTCALCLNVMEHTNVKKICNSCMTKHNFSLSKNQLQLCNLCKQNIECEKFQDHLIEHGFKNESISCVICNSIFTTINGLKEHLREHKITPLDFKETCSKCNARFLYPSELEHHSKEHELVEDQAKNIKQENVDEDTIMKEIKDEEEDDYIEIEKVHEN
ncbi:hypothetical protein PVAND_003352 [Polypedilum vanderplanki]|uniref:C2H2-type domain-containing protein n=1 Tax=Polypedilum vanderplanki TaxID=319348 RepID=A0A9J6BTT6_POLVA|nr:hypothetical protein PVAND_003352 [Polypedilum vanderplanki]